MVSVIYDLRCIYLFSFDHLTRKCAVEFGSIVLVSCNHLFGRSWLQFGVHLNLLSHERSKGSMKYLCIQLAGQESAVRCNPVNMNVINTQLNGSLVQTQREFINISFSDQITLQSNILTIRICCKVNKSNVRTLQKQSVL